MIICILLKFTYIRENIKVLKLSSRFFVQIYFSLRKDLSRAYCDISMLALYRFFSYIQHTKSLRQRLNNTDLYFPGPRPVPKPLGLSNNRLNNRYITASSIWDKYHAAWLARLYNKKRGRYRGGWSAKVNKRGQWIQFDFRRPRKIVKVTTQGRSDLRQYVTRYIIKYSADAFYWTPYRKYSRVQVDNFDIALS